jgi:hypothetical protein
MSYLQKCLLIIYLANSKNIAKFFFLIFTLIFGFPIIHQGDGSIIVFKFKEVDDYKNNMIKNIF